MVDVETCPTLEDIAAFLDGRLTADERARVTLHLADCPTCVELLTGAAYFLAAEEAQAAGEPEDVPAAVAPSVGAPPPLPFRRPDRSAPRSRRSSSSPRWVKRVGYGLAAAAVPVALAVPLLLRLTWQPPLAAALVKTSTRYPNPEPARLHLYEEPRMRGGEGKPPDSFSVDQALMLGVALVDFRVALEANARQETSDGARRIWSRSEDWLDPKVRAFYKDAMAMDVEASRKAPRDLLAEAEAAERKLQQESFSLTYLSLGRWTEAARLAATPAGDHDFLHSHETRSFLAWVQDRKDDPLDPDTAKTLDALRRRLERDNLTQADLKALAGELSDFIKRHERSGA